MIDVTPSDRNKDRVFWLLRRFAGDHLGELSEDVTIGALYRSMPNSLQRAALLLGCDLLSLVDSNSIELVEQLVRLRWRNAREVPVWFDQHVGWRELAPVFRFVGSVEGLRAVRSLPASGDVSQALRIDVMTAAWQLSIHPFWRDGDVWQIVDGQMGLPPLVANDVWERQLLPVATIAGELDSVRARPLSTQYPFAVSLSVDAVDQVVDCVVESVVRVMNDERSRLVALVDSFFGGEFPAPGPLMMSAVVLESVIPVLEAKVDLESIRRRAIGQWFRDIRIDRLLDSIQDGSGLMVANQARRYGFIK